MSVPILDEAWMARRARARYVAAMSESLRSGYGRRSQPARDTAASLREQYATGELTLEQFERRTERMLGC